MKSKSLIKVVSLIWVVLILGTACKLPTEIFSKIKGEIEEQIPTEVETPTLFPTEAEPVTTFLPPEDLYGGKFAEYPIQNVNLPASFSGDYTLPLTLDQVHELNKYDLTKSQKDAILRNGFVVLPPSDDPNRMYQEFYHAYESIRYDETPLFITTDSLLHVYHLLFDKMLRDLEREYFIPTLKELTTAMLDSSAAQLESLRGTALENAATKNLAFFAVPARILGLPTDIPADALALAESELELIEAHSGIEVSPIWYNSDQAQDDVLLEDYSQYIPRGHYTKDEGLKSYFKAMMWMGRMTFRLKDEGETQRSLLMIQAMRSASTASGKTALELWQNIYDPTVFIVGKADDLSIYEYGKISDEVFGVTPPLTSFADPDLMAAFNSAARSLPPPQINSMWVYIWQDRDEATQGFRFMGQRFTLDAYIFGELMWRKVGTLENPRDLPKSLDILAAMGSDEAYSLLQEAGETKYENYDKQLTKVKQEVSGFGIDSWTQNLYWSWLYTLQPVFTVKGEAFPAFMRSQAWQRKDLQTALSSWTELKHDTILYAKQVMAEMGGGPMEGPPKGYVEPNPEVYARLLALTEMTRNGLEARGILDEITRGNLETLIEQLKFLLDISLRELTGSPITDDEYWRIQYYGGWLEALTVAAADPVDPDQGRSYLEDQKSALIADVATGMGRVLEEGVGYPTTIYVVIPTQPYRIGVGAVYSYYEFPVPMADRMTDKQWQEMLESGNAPAAPDWTSLFIIP